MSKLLKCDSCGAAAIGSIQGLGYCADVDCIDKVVGKALTPARRFTELVKP